MKLEPTLLDVPAFSVVGLAGRFIAAMSPDATNMEIIPPLWAGFKQRFGEIDGAFALPKSHEAWGVCRCLPPEQRSREDELEYLAGVQVTGGGELPAGLVRWEVPARRFARFTHRGPIESFSETIAYVYGAWFPRSEYETDFGLELELYDERFKFGKEDSELDFYVGIRAKP